MTPHLRYLIRKNTIKKDKVSKNINFLANVLKEGKKKYK